MFQLSNCMFHRDLIDLLCEFTCHHFHHQVTSLVIYFGCAVAIIYQLLKVVRTSGLNFTRAKTLGQKITSSFQKFHKLIMIISKPLLCIYLFMRRTICA